MASRTEKEVVIKARTKGFAAAQQEAARVARDNAKAIDSQVKGFARTGKAMGEVEKETKRLEGVLQGLAKRQVAINRLMEQTPDKASKAWKQLSQELKQTDREAQRVQRTIQTMDRAFARQREKRQGFAQGLLQGAAPGAMTFLQRGPGMRMQAAGAAIGGIGRQIAGAGAAGLTGGLLQGPQGLVSAMGQIPLIGGLIAAPLQRQLQQAQQGMQFLQQRQAQLPYLGGAGLQRAMRRAGAGAGRLEGEKAREEVMAEVGTPEMEKEVRIRTHNLLLAEAQRRARAEAPKKEGFLANLQGLGGEAPIERIKREMRERSAINQDDELRGRATEIAREGVERDIRARAETAESNARKEATARARARTQRRLIGLGTGTRFGMDLNEELQIRAAVQQVGGGFGITGQEREMGTTAMAAQRLFGISPQIAGAFLQAGRRGGLVGLDATTGARGPGGVPQSFLAARQAQAEEEQVPELQQILEQPQEQARRQVVTFEPEVITARRRQDQTRAEEAAEPTEAPDLQALRQAAVRPPAALERAIEPTEAPDLQALQQAAVRPRDAVERAMEPTEAPDLQALQQAAVRPREAVEGTTLAAQLGRREAEAMVGPAMGILEGAPERPVTEEPDLQRTQARTIARANVDEVFDRILEKAGVVSERPAEAPPAEAQPEKPEMVAAAKGKEPFTEMRKGVTGDQQMPGAGGAAARTVGREARGPADAMSKALTDAMKLGLQGSEINDYLQQMAAGINQWKSTGIPVNADSTKAIGDAVSAMGIGGVRGMAIAGGVGRAAEAIAQQGPQSVGQLMMLRALGGLGAAGGEGTPAQRMEDALIKMERKQFGAEEFNSLIQGLLRAGGGGAEGRRVAFGVLQQAGIQVSRGELKEMAEGASPERIEEIRRQRTAGAAEAVKLDTPAKLAKAAAEATSGHLQAQAKLTNQQIRNGTQLLGGMKALEQTAQNMTNAFTEKFAPLLEKLGKGFEDLSEALTQGRALATASYPETEVSN